MIRRLQPCDAHDMGKLHAKVFDPSCPEGDMINHCITDIVLGYGDPLCGFIIIRPATDQAEILTILADPAHQGQGVGLSLIHI